MALGQFNSVVGLWEPAGPETLDCWISLSFDVGPPSLCHPQPSDLKNNPHQVLTFRLKHEYTRIRGIEGYFGK